MVKPLWPILLILWCSLGQAQIYKWVDEKGRIQYTELPPQNQSYEVLNRASSASQSTATSRPESPATPVITERRQLTRPEQVEVQSDADADAIRAKNCEQARLNIEILEQSQNPVLIDAEGNETALDEEEKQAALARNREYIETYCTP